jgi:hypothetical protein
VPFPSQTPFFSAGPSKSFPSPWAPWWPSLLIHCSQVSQDTLSYDHSLFSRPTWVPQSQSGGPLLRWFLTIAFWGTGNERLSYLMLAYHAGGVTVPYNPHTGVKVCRRHGFCPTARSASLLQRPLAYLEVEALTSPGPEEAVARARAANS